MCLFHCHSLMIKWQSFPYAMFCDGAIDVISNGLCLCVFFCLKAFISISKVVNFDRSNPHTPKTLWESLIIFKYVKRSIKPKCLRTTRLICVA